MADPIPIRPKDLPSAPSVPADVAIMLDNGSVVQKATPAQIADTARPYASKTDAETGTDNAKVMTALRVKQALDSQAIGKAMAAAVGVAGDASNMGTTPGTILSDNGTAKGWFQESEAAIEDRVKAADLASDAATSGKGLNAIGNGTDIVLGSAVAKEDVPQGNPYAPTFTKLSAKLFGDDEVLDGSRGFTFMAGVDNKGQVGTDNVDDMVAGYFGAEGAAYTSGDANTVRKPIWAINTVTFLHSGSGTYNARGIETDFVNSLRNIGSGDGAGYTSEVAAVGIEIFHSGPYQSTAGMLVNVGSDGSVPFYRAYAVAPGAASQAAFADYSDAAYSYDSRGSHAYGLHFVGTYSYNVLNGPLRVGDTSNPEAGIQLDVGGSGNAKVRGFLNVVGATNLEGALGVKLDGTLKAVSVGAADSGGVGYKVLRVAN